MSEAKKYLYNLARQFEENARVGPSDPFQYRRTLDDVLFQAELRFGDYVQFQDTLGEFPVRLREWFLNTSIAKEQKVLLKLLWRLFFIDRSQTFSLCRDAYRRIIVPWLDYGNTPDDFLAAGYHRALLDTLRRYSLFSVTESFYFSDFRNVNNLIGLQKPIILDERTDRIPAQLSHLGSNTEGLIILEDIVGSGSQASRALAEVTRVARPEWRILFAPLLMLEEATAKLHPLQSDNMNIQPVLLISNEHSVKKQPYPGEPSDFKLIRSLVNKTAARVLEPLDSYDDAPENPFGFNGSGAMVVAYRNTPNNTLPLIHHQAPQWKPLFRRVHHARKNRQKKK